MLPIRASLRTSKRIPGVCRQTEDHPYPRCAAQPQFLLKLNCMLLPFVRELFADAEKLPAFARVASHLKEGTGRIRVSGLTPTAKALLLVLFQHAASRPLLLVVNDNRAAEDLVPVLQAFCQLTN